MAGLPTPGVPGIDHPPVDTNGSRADSEPDERSRLLPQPTSEPEPDCGAPGVERPAAASLQRDMVLCAPFLMLLVLIVAGSIFQAVPLNQVLEDIICRQLDLSPRSRGNCGESNIMQAELALLRGWQTTLDLIPGLLTAVPYGFMADKYGRKPVLCLCIAGVTAASAFYCGVCWWPDIFPVRLTWLSCLFFFIGGGAVVLNSILDMILSDLTTDAYRSTAFMAMGAATLASELLISPLASSLMRYDPWLPILIGVGLYAISNVLALALPETLNRRAPPGCLPPDLVTGPEDAREQNGQSHPQQKHPLRSRLFESVERLRAATGFFIWGNRTVALLLLTLLTTDFGKMAVELLLQFARKRFGWPWSKTGYLVSFKAGVLLVLLSVILPTANYVLANVFSAGPRRRDFEVARISCLLLVLGNITIAFSPTESVMLLGVVMWCVGSAYGLILRSLLAMLVEPHHRGTLFTTVAILENTGAVVAGPLLALCFQAGLRLDGVWTGLPFMVAASLCILSLPVLYGIRISQSA